MSRKAVDRVLKTVVGHKGKSLLAVIATTLVAGCLQGLLLGWSVAIEQAVVVGTFASAVFIVGTGFYLYQLTEVAYERAIRAWEKRSRLRRELVEKKLGVKSQGISLELYAPAEETIDVGVQNNQSSDEFIVELLKCPGVQGRQGIHLPWVESDSKIIPILEGTVERFQLCKFCFMPYRENPDFQPSQIPPRFRFAVESSSGEQRSVRVVLSETENEDELDFVGNVVFPVVIASKKESTVSRFNLCLEVGWSLSLSAPQLTVTASSNDGEHISRLFLNYIHRSYPDCRSYKDWDFQGLIKSSMRNKPIPEDLSWD